MFFKLSEYDNFVTKMYSMLTLCPDFVGQMMTKIGARGDVSERSMDLIRRSANLLKEVMTDFPRLPNCDPSSLNSCFTFNFLIFTLLYLF